MADHEKRAHALFNASSADFWMECNLWVHHKMAAEEAGEEYDKGSEAARRGTLCHEAAEAILQRVIDEPRAEFADILISECNNYGLTDEEMDLVETAVNAVIDLISSHGKFEDFVIRTEMDIPLSHEPESNGHVDVVAVRVIEPEDERILMLVVDYKFGETPVSPNSYQLRTYGANAVDYYVKRMTSPVTKGRFEDAEVILAVVQPRLHAEALTRRYLARDLRRFQHHVEYVVENQRSRNDVRGAASLSTCEWCPFRDRCGHRKTLVQGMFKKLKTGDASGYSDQFIEEVVRSRSAIEKVVKEVVQLVVEDELRFPNWSRVHVSNGRTWAPLLSEQEIIKQLKKKGAKDLLALRSPAQVRDANKSMKDIVNFLEKLTVSKGHHVRLYEGTPGGVPKEEPPKRPARAVKAPVSRPVTKGKK